MRHKIMAAIGILLMASPSFAELSKDEVKRLSDSASIVTELRSSPDKGIPEDLWEHAECVLVIPSLKKAAFIVGGEYGSGVMSCRSGAMWSAPIFMQLAKGSWGFQIGAQEIDLVLLVMNRRGANKLLDDKVSLGADASVAAGPVGRVANAATDAQFSAEMLAYSHTRGLFAGVDVSGGVLRPDKEAAERAYGPGITARQVIESGGNVSSPVAAKQFLAALSSDVIATTGRK
jgi:lipid-binding SYLF domain-containing protein